MVKKPQRPRRVRTCVYCGKSEEPKGERFTRDHVLPKSLFNVLDRQMITVLACSACQEEKRYGDDDLRDFVNLHYAGAQHPEAQEQLLKIAASTLGGHSKIGNAFWSTGQLRERFSEAGLYLGDVVEAPIPGNNRDMFKTLEYIVRGLYFHTLNTPCRPNPRCGRFTSTQSGGAQRSGNSSKFLTAPRSSRATWSPGSCRITSRMIRLRQRGRWYSTEACTSSR